MAVASAYFSLFAFDELKRELHKSKDFRFLYTEPTFYHHEKDRNHQYQIHEKKSSYPVFDGNSFEVSLRNKMKLKTMAKDAAEWIRNDAQFKTVLSEGMFPKQLLLQNEKGSRIQVHSEIDFTADGLGVTADKKKEGVMHVSNRNPFMVV